MSAKPPVGKPTAKQLQKALHHHLEHKRHHRPVVPNHHFPFWYECDVLSVTKTMFWNEYEIKLSRADFRKDALKSSAKGYGRNRVETSKYDALRAGQGPNRFTYVTPPGLLKPEELPDFAGLIEVDLQYVHPRVSYVKQASQLHSRKLEAKQIQSLYRLFYWRYWGVFDKIT